MIYLLRQSMKYNFSMIFLAFLYARARCWIKTFNFMFPTILLMFSKCSVSGPASLSRWWRYPWIDISCDANGAWKSSWAAHSSLFWLDRRYQYWRHFSFGYCVWEKSPRMLEDLFQIEECCVCWPSAVSKWAFGKDTQRGFWRAYYHDWYYPSQVRYSS